MQLARTIYEPVNSTLLTWQEVSVSLRPVLLVSDSARPPRSTSPSPPWETSSLPWWTDAPNTSPTGTPSWPGCCRTLWEETHAHWWSPVSPRRTTTMRRAWARCAMPTGQRASRTGPVSMRTPKMLCSESTRRRSRSCGPSSQASWALLTFHVSDLFCDCAFWFKGNNLFLFNFARGFILINVSFSFAFLLNDFYCYVSF